MSREEFVPLLSQLTHLKAQGERMGGPERIERQHSRGKLTARERVDAFLDPGTFEEYGVLAVDEITIPGRETTLSPAAGVITGLGAVDGRPVLVCADDATIAGGARGLAGLAKVQKLQIQAVRRRTPLVYMLEASAGRVDDQLGNKFANFFADPHTTLLGDMVAVSGVVPTASAIVGSTVGGASFTAAISDFTTMVRGTGHMAVAGPPVVAGATGETATFEELGGADVHARLTGLADHVATDEVEALQAIRRFLSFMPQHCDEMPPVVRSEDPSDRACHELLDSVPVNLRRAYDIRPVVKAIVDRDSMFELQPEFGASLVVALVRFDGMVAGLIASQPKIRGGVLDAPAARKLEHFMMLCDAYHIPLVFLVDTPGFMVGSDTERQGLIAGAARLLQLHRDLTVPKVTVVLRKAYGLAYSILGGTPVNPDSIAAWPIASFSVMDPTPAVNVLFGREIQSAAHPKAKREELTGMLQSDSNPFGAARRFGIDEVIDPATTRQFICSRLRAVVASGGPPGFRRRVARI